PSRRSASAPRARRRGCAWSSSPSPSQRPVLGALAATPLDPLGRTRPQLARQGAVAELRQAARADRRDRTPLLARGPLERELGLDPQRAVALAPIVLVPLAVAPAISRGRAL